MAPLCICDSFRSGNGRMNWLRLETTRLRRRKGTDHDSPYASLRNRDSRTLAPQSAIRKKANRRKRFIRKNSWLIHYPASDMP